MLPILKSLEFAKILPLSENSIEKIAFRDGINKFLAENGSGKTTLTDLIEHSLVRDAHAFAWNIFSKKRVDKNAYVKAEWLFGNKSTIITHEFTDAGARTRVTAATFSNKAHTKDMYSDFLFTHTNLTLEQMQKLFEGVFYKRENDLNLLGTPGEESLMDFFELLNKTIRMESPTTIKLRNQIGEIKRQIELRKNSKRKIEAQLEKMEIIFASAETSADALESIGNRKGELERSNRKLREEIEQQRKLLQQLEKENEQTLNELDNYQGKLLQNRLKQDEIKTKQYTVKTQLDKLERELKGFTKLAKVNYSEIKAQWEKKQTCELCGSAIFDNWSERISKGCPVCGTEWKQIPASVKETISKNEIESETRDIQKEIDSLKLKSQALDEDLAKFKREEERYITTLKNLREKLTTNGSRQRELQKRNEEINLKIQKIGMELGSLSAQEKMVNQDESIALLHVNLDKINAELEDYYLRLERLEKELPEQKELQHILNNFARITKEIFGYSMLADTETRIITITKDDSSRDFAALSWSERYFIDVVFRIAIFNFLIENNIMSRGLLILDSPEAALDPTRLDLLADIINKHKDNATFIIATRVKKFYDKLEGHPLEIHKQTQMSLFDFIGFTA